MSSLTAPKSSNENHYLADLEGVMIWWVSGSSDEGFYCFFFCYENRQGKEKVKTA